MMATAGPPESLELALQEALLQCPICLETLKEPKALPCVHTFCHRCLQEWHQRGKDPAVIECPFCKASHQLPKGGVADLPTDHKINTMKDVLSQHDAFSSTFVKPLCSICKSEGSAAEATVYCFSCKQPFCVKCVENHDRKKNYKAHLHADISEDPESASCTVHRSQFVSRFCQNCARGICEICAVQDSDDHKHYGLVNSKMIQHENHYSSDIKKSVDDLKYKKAYIVVQKHENDKNASRCKDQIREYTAKLRKAVDKQEETLLACVDKYYNLSAAEIAKSEAKLDDTLKVVTDVENQIDHWIHPVHKQRHISHEAPVPMKFFVKSKLPDVPLLSKTYEYNFTPNAFTVLGKLKAPNMDHGKRTKAEANMRSEISKVFDVNPSPMFDGNIITLSGIAECRNQDKNLIEYPKPVWMTSDFNGINRLNINRRSSGIVGVATAGVSLQKCVVLNTIQDKLDEIFLENVHSVALSDDGQLIATTLSRTGNQITTSLRCYSASSDEALWVVDTSPGKSNYSLTQPDYITTDRQGRIFVSDVGNDVYIYDDSGKFQAALFKELGETDFKPSGVCVDDDDNILVALMEPYNSVWLFRGDLKFVKVVVTVDDIPWGICVTDDETHLAVGTETKGLRVYQL